MSSDDASEARRMVTLTGLATSRGFAAGSVFLHNADGGVLSVVEREISAADVSAELARFAAAMKEARRQIEALAARLEGQSAANVFANHLVILEDPLIVAQIEDVVRKERVNIEAAIRRVVERFRARFGQMDDPYLRERIRDIEDIERRMLRILLGREEMVFASITSPVIIVADDLAPSETVALSRELVLGIATDHGSATSHVALLSRRRAQEKCAADIPECFR